MSFCMAYCDRLHGVAKIVCFSLHKENDPFSYSVIQSHIITKARRNILTISLFLKMRKVLDCVS